MKVKKIVPHLNWFGSLELINKDNATVWEGSILNFQAAIVDDIQYRTECVKDKSFSDVYEFDSAIRYFDWYLDTTSEYKAIEPQFTVNEHGVTIPHIIINIKEKKND